VSMKPLLLTDSGAQPDGVLVTLALNLLRDGPQSTDTVAERVLGLRGNPGAAALAVFTLLGSDARFRVDAAGAWSLTTPPTPVIPAAFADEEWVVVDVETTGGSPEQGHRVTEVAAVRVRNGAVCESYSTLVNPQRRIPAMITSITGISDSMVRDAPVFHEIAPRLQHFMGGGVFVAHNASFDWRFLCSELNRAVGRPLTGRQLCTVKLARKLLPQLPSRSLDGLAVYFGLEIESRHRALDDAVATAHVLLRFVDMLQDRGIADWEGLQTVLGARSPRRKRTAMPRSMDSA
jgi:DNA polymerase III epsilon subunit family exonuclease